jgi:hypothetical protein
MNFVEALSFTYQSINANKLRSTLTMLGMVIGTASIILVVTIALTGRDCILDHLRFYAFTRRRRDVRHHPRESGCQTKSNGGTAL